MQEVTITVRGENETRVAPERARVHATVQSEGAQREATVQAALRAAETLRASVVERSDAGTVVEWTSTRLAVYAQRPWNSEGRRLAPVHHASVDFTVTFADASELSEWVTLVSEFEGVQIANVEWELTPQTRTETEREVAASAVGVAVARACAYASALGLRDVVAVEIADTGLLTRAAPAQPETLMAMAAVTRGGGAGAPAMEFAPEDIVVSASVEARFLAR